MASSVRVGVVDVHKGLRLFQPMKRDFEFEIETVGDDRRQSSNISEGSSYAIVTDKNKSGVKMLVLR